MTEQAYWNGEPCEARRVVVTVADDERFPLYWAREFVGQRRRAVEVRYGEHVFYLDDEEPARGWDKVTLGHGSPRFGHRELTIEPGSVAGPSVEEFGEFLRETDPDRIST